MRLSSSLLLLPPRPAAPACSFTRSIHRAVSPDEPREQRGLYWGYQTRLAAGIPEIFSECPYEGGYDLKIGTSEVRTIVLVLVRCTLCTELAPIVNCGAHSSVDGCGQRGADIDTVDFGGDGPSGAHSHMLIVFGGVAVAVGETVMLLTSPPHPY